MITYGTNPGMVVPITAAVPDHPSDAIHAKSLAYMGLQGGEPLLGKPVQVVFVGSCTNGRLSDLEQAARVLRGRKVASGVRMLVVPGSQQVKREAEARGLAQGLYGRWRRVARIRLLDVYRHERRPRGEGPVRGEHEQSQLRRPPGRRCAHVAREPADCCRRRGGRSNRRSARIPRGVTMQPIRTLTSRTVVLPFTNIDTDQIIPARFLTTTTKEGLGRQAFADWRYDASGAPKPDFALNRAGGRRLRDSRRRAQFRLRLLARARAVGIAGFRLPRRRQHRDRRHLP